jgi:hypothetical protein
VSIWNFHAADDGTVNVSNSRSLINGLRALGGTPIYTEFASGGHTIWSGAYATPLLYGWLMSQRRGVPTNVPPFVTITSPTDQPYLWMPTNSISLAGTAGNAVAGITQITWSNDHGGSGTAAGTTNWSVPTVPLQNATNTLTVMATGAAWVSSYGGSTTFSDVLRMDATTTPPSITSRPVDVNVALGASASFSLRASGTLPLSYQWRFNGADIPGATSTMYVVTNVQPANLGYYSAFVTNLYGSTISPGALLGLLLPPTVASQPQSQTLPAASTVAFTVVANGTAPLNYQWLKDGATLSNSGKFSGVTTATLTVANVQATEMGGYSVVVTNSLGQTASGTAALALWPLLGWGWDNYGQADIPAGLTNVTALAGGLSQPGAVHGRDGGNLGSGDQQHRLRCELWPGDGAERADQRPRGFRRLLP